MTDDTDEYEDWEDNKPHSHCCYCGSHAQEGYCWASPDGWHLHDEDPATWQIDGPE